MRKRITNYSLLILLVFALLFFSGCASFFQGSDFLETLEEFSGGDNQSGTNVYENNKVIAQDLFALLEK